MLFSSHRTRVFLVVLGLALGTFSCRTSTLPDSEISRKLDALFADLHGRGLFQGAAVVGRGRQIVWEAGFGHAEVERQVPFTPETPSDTASVAKTFTSTLLISLEREGRLSLDDPARRFLPELPYDNITIRHLISHSGGLPWDYAYFDPFIAPDRVRTTEGLLAVIAAEKPPLAFEPGTAFEYNSIGFDLAALAAARAAGQPYGSLLSERFFRPLGMATAFLRPARLSDFPGVRTRGYRRVEGKWEPNEVFDFEGFHGGSNIYLSARDLHRWSSAFLSGGAIHERDRITVLKPVLIGGHPSGISLGSWYRSGDGRAAWYAGHLQGFRTEMFRDIETQWSIVYTSNNTLEPWLQRAIVRAIQDIVAGGTPGALQPPPTVAVSKTERPLLADTWQIEGGEILSIVSADNRLNMVRAGVSYWMVPVSPTTFYVPGLDFMIGFTRRADGSFETMHVSSNVAEKWATRVHRQAATE